MFGGCRYRWRSHFDLRYFQTIDDLAERFFLDNRPTYIKSAEQPRCDPAGLMRGPRDPAQHGSDGMIRTQRTGSHLERSDIHLPLPSTFDIPLATGQFRQKWICFRNRDVFQDI